MVRLLISEPSRLGFIATPSEAHLSFWFLSESRIARVAKLCLANPLQLFRPSRFNF